MLFMFIIFASIYKTICPGITLSYDCFLYFSVASGMLKYRKTSLLLTQTAILRQSHFDAFYKVRGGQLTNHSYRLDRCLQSGPFWAHTTPISQLFNW